MFFVGFSCRSGGVFATKTDTNLGTKSPNEGSWSPCLSGVSWTLCATLTLDPFRLLSKHEKVAISCNTCQHCLSKICTFPITSRTNVTTCWLVDYFPLPAKDTIRDQIEIKKNNPTSLSLCFCYISHLPCHLLPQMFSKVYWDIIR